MITQELLQELLDYDPDTGVFTWLRRPGNDRCTNSWNARYAGNRAGLVNARGYRMIRIGGPQYRAHRLAWLYVHGEWPADQIDHINGVSDDNRIANLREATNSENCRNKGKMPNNTSGFKGVYWNKNTRKWLAGIRVSLKFIPLGYYDCPKEAAAAYAVAAAKYHGEFARL